MTVISNYPRQLEKFVLNHISLSPQMTKQLNDFVDPFEKI